MISRRHALQLLSLALSGCTPMELDPPKPVGPLTPNDEMQERLRARVKPFVSATPDAAIAVALVDASGSRTLGFGRTGTHDPHPPRGDAVFEIGGLGELFVALLLADTIARGRVSLDTEAGEKLTLGSLALHTSGLSPKSRETALLGDFLAKREGHTLGALLAERVTAPLGLVSTATFERSAPLEERLAEGLDSAGRPVAPRFQQNPLDSAYSLRSTPVDLARLIALLLAPSGPLAQALASVCSVRRLPSGADAALGFDVDTARSRLWQHGVTRGFRSALVLDPSRGRGLCLLAGSTRVDAPTLAYELLREQDLPSYRSLPPARPVVAGLPRTATAASADFGFAALAGHAVDRPTARPGESVNITLYWRSLRRTDRDWQLLIEFEDADKQVVGKETHYPAERSGTFAWKPGELLVDELSLRLPRASGRVTLWLTWFGAGATQNATPGPDADLRGRARGPSVEVPTSAAAE